MTGIKFGVGFFFFQLLTQTITADRMQILQLLLLKHSYTHIDSFQIQLKKATNAHMRSILALSNLPEAALEAVPLLAWRNTDRSPPWMADRQPLAFPTLISRVSDQNGVSPLYVTLHHEMSRNVPVGLFRVFIFSENKCYAIYNGKNHFQIRGLGAELHFFKYGGMTFGTFEKTCFECWRLLY